jgi:vacuolar-type H+-ATPase subunit E/Vma4
MNTLEEDIKTLERAVMAEARAEAEKIEETARQKTEAVHKQAQTQAEAERKAILDQARQEADRIRGQSLATGQLKGRTLQLESREKLLSQVFEKVRQQIGDVTKSKEYEKITINLLREALSQLNAKTAVVHADKLTMKILTDGALEKVAKDLKVELSEGKMLDGRTGVLVEASQGRLVYDNTLETRLDRLKNSLRSSVYQILSGESK